jgi:hypothetical protein
MNTPYVLFARTLLSPAYSGTTLYIWGIPGIRPFVTYCKLLCYRTVGDKEYAYAIVPHGDGYRWQDKGRMGQSATFAQAWSQLPAFLTNPAAYRDSPWVRVAHTGTTLLFELWFAKQLAARAARNAVRQGAVQGRVAWE